MKKPALLVALVTLTTVAACHHAPPAPEPAKPMAPAAPPLAPPPPAPREVVQTDDYANLKAKSAEEIDRMGLFGDVHFEFDRADIREGDRAILSKNADVLKKFDFLKITVEGHCDERGTTEYNLALGERRAKASYDYLVSLGVQADRLKTLSYGKEVPVCQEHGEDCWSRNRRDRFTVTGKTAK